jgi:protein-L-isoaspartate O-methyltransferase
MFARLGWIGLAAFTAMAQIPGTPHMPLVAQVKIGRPEYAKKLAPYVASPQRVVERMLEMAAPKPGEIIYDLGCGDGRILFCAAEKYQMRAVGIEIDEKLVQQVSDSIARRGMQQRVAVKQGNLLDMDLSEADVVTIYLMTQSNEVLRPKLEKMLRPGARVVSYDYAVPGWKPKRVDKSEEARGHLIYLYEMPPAKQ